MKVSAPLVNSTPMPASTNNSKIGRLNLSALQASIIHAPIVGDREVAVHPDSEVLRDRHALRVQVAVNASPHIILLSIELVALKCATKQ